MTETPKKTRRWIMPLLLVSLALNLLVIGIVVGWMASLGGGKRAEFGPARGLLGEPFLRALPMSERRALLRDIARESPRLRESRETLRARFEAFLAALRAEPYDSASVAALLKDQRAAALRRQDIGEQFLLERLQSMTPQQRVAYADALERYLKRPRQ